MKNKANMFWILRRTGAANFFNSLNNNCNTSKTNNNNNSSSNNRGNGNSSNLYTLQKKYVKRPPRKAYGRLNTESDEVLTPTKQKLEMISTASHCTNDNVNDDDNINNSDSLSCTRGLKRIENNMIQFDDADNNMNCILCDTSASASVSASASSSSTTIIESCTIRECQGKCNCKCNYNDTNGTDTLQLSHPFRNDNNRINNGTVDKTHAIKLTPSSSSTSSCTSAMYCYSNHNNNNNNNNSNNNSNSNNQKGVNHIIINRLQALAISEDDDDYDESLTCNVCDRSFHCERQLASHQQKKRHFGCCTCDNLFPSLMLLEHHKEEFQHWSDNELHEHLCCIKSIDYFTDTDSFSSDAESEDLERLL